MLLKTAQRNTLERALAAYQELEEKLSYLEQIAAQSPQYAERVRLLRERQQWGIALATVAITADSSSGR